MALLTDLVGDRNLVHGGKFKERMRCSADLETELEDFRTANVPARRCCLASAIQHSITPIEVSLQKVNAVV